MDAERYAKLTAIDGTCVIAKPASSEVGALPSGCAGAGATRFKVSVAR